MIFLCTTTAWACRIVEYGKVVEVLGTKKEIDVVITPKTGETIDPYVVVSVHDVKRDEEGRVAHVVSSHTTSAVNDNGFCPVWREKKFKDFVVYNPDVAMIHFSLREADMGLDDKVGDTCIPVICLRTGVRSVQLFDSLGTRTGPYGFASLLVEIQSSQLTI